MGTRFDNIMIVLCIVGMFWLGWATGRQVGKGEVKGKCSCECGEG